MPNEKIANIDNELTNIELVLKAARALDRDALAELQESCIWLDEVDPHSQMTAIEQLAFENNTEALDLLLDMGVLPHRAVRGAARGSHAELVTRLMEEGDKRNRIVLGGRLIDWAAQGAAEAGDEKRVVDFIRAGADKKWALEGAGRGNHRTLVDKLIDDEIESTNSAHERTGRGRPRTRDDYYRPRTLDDYYAYDCSGAVEKNVNVNWALRGAGQGNHKELAEYLIKEKKAYSECEIEGVMQGGHKGRSFHSKSPVVRIAGAMANGDPESVSHVFGGVNLNWDRRNVPIYITQGVQCGHFLLIKKVIPDAYFNIKDFRPDNIRRATEDMMNSRSISIDSSMPIIIRAAYDGGQDDLIKMLCRHRSLVRSIARGAAEGGHFELINHLIRNGHAIGEIVVGIEDFIKGEDDIFRREEEWLELLANITDEEARNEIAQKFGHPSLGKYQRLGFNLTDLLPLANRIADYREIYELSYEQALLIAENPGLLGWLSEGKHLPLSKDMRLLVASRVVEKGAASRAFLEQIANKLEAPLTNEQQKRLDMLKQHQSAKSRLRKQYDTNSSRQQKWEKFDQAVTIAEETKELCQHRHTRSHKIGLWRHSDILPKTIREVMRKEPSIYRNLTALQQWFHHLTEYMQKPLSSKASKITAERISRVLEVLSSNRKFRMSSSEPKDMRDYIDTEVDGRSLRSLVQNTPYWDDLTTLFPQLELNDIDQTHDDRGAGLDFS